ncbi:MAG: NifU family protein [Bacteroidetes bacterium]|nr:NifU family protein [Bacteroidota bacterium]MCB9044079.1 NifU family protein [Chitinophagales bacterium]
MPSDLSTHKINLLKKAADALLPIKPYLEKDGGDIEIVDITDDFVLLVRLMGNCNECPMSPMTMRAGVEQAIRSAVPEIVAVQAVD